MTCVICEHRPAKVGGYCVNCASKIEADKRNIKSRQPVKFATYRGHVIGFYPFGSGKLIARLLRRKPENLPKLKTLNLDTYIPGFEREQVKKIKTAILTLVNG